MDYENNKQQDIAIMLQKSGVSKDKIIQGLNNSNLLNLTYNYLNSMNKNSNQTNSLYKTGSDIVKFYAGSGVISEYPNIDNLVDPKFVNALSKEDNISIFQ